MNMKARDTGTFWGLFYMEANLAITVGVFPLEGCLYRSFSIFTHAKMAMSRGKMVTLSP